MSGLEMNVNMLNNYGKLVRSLLVFTCSRFIRARREMNSNDLNFTHCRPFIGHSTEWSDYYVESLVELFPFSFPSYVSAQSIQCSNRFGSSALVNSRIFRQTLHRECVLKSFRSQTACVLMGPRAFTTH